ncbi:MAG TPA: CrcB family protein [Acidimicrobiales bacterium]|nr:CrcB family protein [Acidimicrobiales bacterium]
MTRVALIGVFGAAGALTRLGISNAIDTRTFPWATLLINVTGSFALGLLLTWGATRLSHDVGSALAIGFLGAYTTYSTFAVDVTILGDDGRVTAAGLYLAATVVLGIAAAAVGVALGRTLVDA